MKKRALISAMTLTLILLSPRLANADTAVSACGSLISYAAPSATRPVGQVSINQQGREVDYQVTGAGSVTPPNITALGTGLNPVIAAFRGTADANGVVREFTLTQVPSCPQSAAGLPNTSTAPADLEAPFALLVLMVGVVGVFGLGVHFRCRSKAVVALRIRQ